MSKDTKSFNNKTDLIEKIQEKWNLSYERASQLCSTNSGYIQEGLLLSKSGESYDNNLKNLNISNDLKDFLCDIKFIDFSIIDYGKTYNDDEFYLRLDIDNNNYINDKNGNIKYNDRLIQVKFIGVISIDVDSITRGYVNYMYEKIHHDYSYDLRLCLNGKFMAIHAKDIVIEVLI
ncbi:MAG: hypothetical protein RSG52_07365 [Terrisporobacter sp.]|uniref:hypothetical protein n=1 Tax=Terrisporobacter sp. TaxID=1965305 RepID=UPI002FC60B71